MGTAWTHRQCVGIPLGVSDNRTVNVSDSLGFALGARVVTDNESVSTTLATELVIKTVSHVDTAQVIFVPVAYGFVRKVHHVL